MLLSMLVEPGDADVDDLIVQHGAVETVERIWAGAAGERLGRITAAALAAGPNPAVRAVALAAATEACGARVIIPGDPEWPSQLHDLGRLDLDGEAHVRPPRCLWVKGTGSLAALCEQSVTITGSRAASEYGKHVADDLAADMAAAGWTVATGGALGIERSAALGAMARDGATVSVLPSGLDAPFPRPNRSMFDLVSERGLLVSEWPPGTTVMRHRFLVRGRTLAALTAGTVVVEAPARSAAFNVARFATGLGRVVMFTPGPVTSSLSAGVHHLARAMPGARLVTCADEVLDDLAGKVVPAMALPVPGVGFDALPVRQQWVLEALPHGFRVEVERLAAAAGLPVADASEALAALRDAGWAEAVDDRWKRTTGPDQPSNGT
jgi:DNA processing protein